MKRWLDYLILPAEVTPFEEAYLRRMNRIGLVFLWLHLPAFMAVAFFNDTGALRAAALTLAVLSGATLAARTLPRPRAVSVVYGFAAMCMGGLLVHFGQGPMQIEMHFYFFTLLALLAVFANPLVILTAALTVALHHLALWLVVPRSVFNYDAPVWAVAVHTAFVAMESVAACFVARSFFNDVIGLERIVRQRTAEVEQRSAAMRLVLDNVNQGLLTLNRDGTMASERSAMVDRWLGAPRPGVTFWAHVAAIAPEVAAVFELGWEALLDNDYLYELLLDQMPKRMVLGEQVFSLAYQAILQGDALDKVLLVISDITAEVARERADTEQRDLLAAVEKIIANRRVFADFYADAGLMVEELGGEWTSPRDALRRLLHTLKGNASTFGLAGLATLCHEIEARMTEEGGVVSAADRQELKARWRRFAALVDRILGGKHRRIEIVEAEHAAILDGLLAGEPRAALARMIEAWKLQPLEDRLEHFADQARDLCQRLGKVPVAVTIEASGLRVAGAHWSAFFGALSHVVRNAVDHGLEEPAERRDAGKAPEGSLALRAFTSGPDFVLEIADDGRGIAWERVAERARAAGLPWQRREELVEALFADGVSTKAEVTEISGRGVGMGAVREACRRLHGTIGVSSEAGQGTTFTFRFPASTLESGYFISSASRPPTMMRV